MVALDDGHGQMGIPMDFLNETPLATHMERAQLFYRDLIQAIVAVKGTYEVLPSGETRLAEQQRPLLLEDTETPYGTLDAEIVPAKAWCDVALLGHARCRDGGRPMTSMRVSILIGTPGSSAARCGGSSWSRVTASADTAAPAR
jgi:hypothetical protein